MKVIPLGSGVAPAITAIPGGWRVAIGGRPEGVVVLDVDLEGRTIVTRTFAGFGFPVLEGPWLGYKTTDADGSRARLCNLASDERHTYDPTPGNFPLAIGQGLFAWQSGTGYAINTVALTAPEVMSQPHQQGAPDGLAWIEPDGSVALAKDVRTSVAGMLNPSRCGKSPAYTYVGEQPDLATQWPLGLSVKRLPLSPNGWALGGQECNTPKIAESADGTSFAIVTYGREGVRLLLLTAGEFTALPKPPAAQSTPEPPPPPPPLPEEPPMTPIGPTPTQWIEVEFPQLEAQFVTSGLGTPGANMAAFLTLRRYGYFPGEVWSFERLLADLVAQGVANGSIPKEAP